jgi:type II secretory pathway pseudopilin PulG
MTGKGIARAEGSISGSVKEKGFTYVWIMFAVAVLGVTVAAAGQAWRTEARREKEKELMFVGDQFAQAIGSYYEESPGMKRYPDSLEKLLQDKRYPTIKRHLRKIFTDPMTGNSEWGLVTQQGVGIIGVHSLSTRKPLKRANFPERYATFADAEDYRDWKFVYVPGDTGGTGARSQPQAGGSLQPQPGTQPGPGSPSRPPTRGAPATPPFPGMGDPFAEDDPASQDMDF